MAEELFTGYTVEALEEDKRKVSAAYKITGPRKVFYLVRNSPNPEMPFVWPEGMKGGKIRGYEWFTDKGGKLRPVS